MFARGISPAQFVQRAQDLTEHGTQGWSRRQKSEYVSEVAAFARGQPAASLLTEGESLVDDEIEYMMDNMTIVLSEIASNPAYLGMNSDDDGYEMRGEMNDTLVRLFRNNLPAKSGGGGGSSKKNNKSASDWVPPQSHGLRNSRVISSSDDADVKESIDYFKNASRGNKMAAGSSDDKMGGSMQAKQDRDDAPERAEGKADDSSQFGAGQVDFKAAAAAGYKGGAADEDEYKGGGEEVDGDEEWDEDYDEEDEEEEEEERRPATMSAGLMRMLGMEVKEELATDWTPPALTGLGNSGRIVEDRVDIRDTLR